MKNDKDLPGQFGRSTYEPPPDQTNKKVRTIRVDGVEVVIRIQEYHDSRIFELQLANTHRDLNIGKQLAHDAFLISIGLQHGTPLEAYIRPYSKSKASRTMPVEGYPGVEKAHSTMDAVMQVLAKEYGIQYGPQLSLAGPEKKPAWKPRVIDGDLGKPESNI